jgi:tetratricopeptide (TPR) repeat protein
MSRKIFCRRSNAFSACFLIFMLVLFSSNAAAQDATRQSPPKQSVSCKPDDNLCRQIEQLTEQIAERKKNYQVGVEFLYYKRAELYFEKGEYKRALGDLGKFEKRHPVNTVLRGSLYLKLGQNDDAFKIFDAFIKQNCISFDVFYGRAVIYYHQREYELALNDFERAIELNRRNSSAYYYRALLTIRRAVKLGENAETSEQAITEYKKAVEDLTSVIEIDLDKVNPQVLFKRAQLYEALGDTINAAADRKTYEELTQKP